MCWQWLALTPATAVGLQAGIRRRMLPREPEVASLLAGLARQNRRISSG